MLGLLVSGLVLMVLLQVFSNDELDFWPAVIYVFVASIVSGIVHALIVSALGPNGVYLSIALVTVLIGVSLSALWGLDLKRATIIGAIFMAFQIGWELFWNKIL